MNRKATLSLRIVLATVAVTLGAVGWAVAGGRAWLGVNVSHDSEHPDGGAVIERVLVGAPAESAGLSVGDVIVAIDGDAVAAPADLRRKLASLAPGDRTQVTVVRDGSRRNLDVRLGEAPGVGEFMVAPDVEFVAPEIDPEEMERLAEEMARMREEHFRIDEDRARELREHAERLRERSAPLVVPRFEWFGRPVLGVELVDVTPELRRHLGTDRDAGVLVGKVLDDSAAERAGIRVGDLILAVDGDEVRTSSELAERIRSRAGEEVAIEVLRDGRSLTLEAALPEPEMPDPTKPRALVAPPALLPAPAPLPAPEPVVAPPPIAVREPIRSL